MTTTMDKHWTAFEWWARVVIQPNWTHWSTALYRLHATTQVSALERISLCQSKIVQCDYIVHCGYQPFRRQVFLFASLHRIYFVVFSNKFLFRCISSWRPILQYISIYACIYVTIRQAAKYCMRWLELVLPLFMCLFFWIHARNVQLKYVISSLVHTKCNKKKRRNEK